MKLKELLSEVRVLECTAALETEIRDISFDSRTTQPGDLFVAVCGYESDGHRFIGMATEKGAEECRLIDKIIAIHPEFCKILCSDWQHLVHLSTCFHENSSYRQYSTSCTSQASLAAKKFVYTFCHQLLLLLTPPHPPPCRLASLSKALASEECLPYFRIRCHLRFAFFKILTNKSSPAGEPTFIIFHMCHS